LSEPENTHVSIAWCRTWLQ